MVHCPESIVFISRYNELAATLREPLEQILRLEAAPDASPPDGSGVLGTDFFSLLHYLWYHLDIQPGPDNLRAAFLFDLYEDREQPECSLSIPEHLKRFAETVHPFSEKLGVGQVPHYNIARFREIDIYGGSHFAGVWKGFLDQVVQKAFALGPITPREHQLLEEIIRILAQAQEGKRQDRFVHPEGPALALEISSTIRVLLRPLLILRQNFPEEFASSPRLFLATRIERVIKAVLNLNGGMNKTALDLLQDIAPSIGICGDVIVDIRKYVLDCSSFPEANPDVLPDVIEGLDAYDRKAKTDHGGAARKLLFDVASSLVKAGGSMNEPGEQWLQRYSATLFGKESGSQWGGWCDSRMR